LRLEHAPEYTATMLRRDQVCAHPPARFARVALRLPARLG
jgi:hypothetical protein